MCFKFALTTFVLTACAVLLTGCGLQPKPAINFYARGSVKAEQDFRPKHYTHVAIYDSGTKGDNSDSVSFNELTIADFFKLCGYKIVGEKVADRLPEGTVLGVRYQIQTRGLLRLNPRVMILLEDFTTDQTLFVSIGSTGSSSDSAKTLEEKGGHVYDAKKYSQIEMAFYYAFKELLMKVDPDLAPEEVTEEIENLFI